MIKKLLTIFDNYFSEKKTLDYLQKYITDYKIIIMLEIKN